MPYYKDATFGFKAVGVFLIFGTTMATLAGITLAFPGTSLDRMWALNPQAYAQMSPLGRRIGVLFLLLAAALAGSAIGWLKHRYWGWILAVGIICTQALGDLVNAIRGDLLRGITGFVIAGALLIYLFRPAIRRQFH